ncbi:hypothetical protein EG68_05418 [Paragonimus skrjabini miyazakii]|uniref:TM2 domain-containing protein n=1 Tax=Paragonimus skrjabini miyazakii TaxID=59628 RepID=A0A8S9YPP1_9TREM|nr:hypothetical protein EG68_05418 [Paragonimus skrjabini miyazakii]
MSYEKHEGLMAVSSRESGFVKSWSVAGILASEERFFPVSPRYSSGKNLRMNVLISCVLVNLIFCLLVVTVSSSEVNISCSYLQLGQYKCDSPQIDQSTQQPVNCSSQTLTAPVTCSSGYRFESALLLSVFGGVFGFDRFYLGYPALGCFKAATFGGFGLWYLADIVLLAVGAFIPADGSSLLVPYYDQPVTLLTRSSVTVYVE